MNHHRPHSIILYLFIFALSSLSVNAQKHDSQQYERAKAFFDEGRFDRAIQIYQEIVRQEPDSLQAHLGLGAVYLTQLNFSLALKAYNRVIALNPSLHGAYGNRGIIYSKQGEYKRAIADFQQALRITPNFEAAYFGLGFAYQRQGKYEQAVKEYEKMLPAESPDDIRLHHNLARCYVRLGRIEEAKREREIVQRLRKLSDAIEAAQQKIRENPDDSNSYVELAKLYAENNLSDEALEAYITALQNDSHAMEAYDGAASVYIQRNRSKDGLAIYEMAIEVEPEYLKGHLMLGLLHRKHGQQEKSAEHLEIACKLAQKLVEKAPNAENMDMLASVYYAIRDYAQAEATLQKAIELAPDNEQIQDHLNQVRQLRKREE